jgi:hypothetical protein
MFCCSSRDDGTKANQNATRACATNAGIPPARVSARLEGVGIVFQQDPTGALHVKSLTPRGPAEKCGLVNMGDMLYWINRHYVYRKPVALLVPLILGLEGTVVRLVLQRGTLQGLVYVRPPPSSSINARSRSVTHMCICTRKIYTLDMYLRIQVEVRRAFTITLLPQPLHPPL